MLFTYFYGGLVVASFCWVLIWTYRHFHLAALPLVLLAGIYAFQVFTLPFVAVSLLGRPRPISVELESPTLKVVGSYIEFGRAIYIMGVTRSGEVRTYKFPWDLKLANEVRRGENARRSGMNARLTIDKFRFSLEERRGSVKIRPPEAPPPKSYGQQSP